MDIFCSTIIPTIGRLTLSRAVNSVLDQSLNSADFEVIVVNDSGRPLPDTDWLHSDRVQVINTNHRERSVARNTGAAIAKGDYLHFLDDDDILLPGALETLWKLRQVSNADCLCGSYQTVNNDGNLIEELHPEFHGNVFSILVAGESVPFQVSLLRTSLFFNIGGFDPDPVLLGVEDRDVERRFTFHGLVAYTPCIVAKIRIGEQGSTTNWKTVAEGDRWGREKALNLQDAFAHLRASANSHYLHGRVSRAYFASMVWNLKRKNLFIAASRLTAGMTFTGFHILSPSFWEGLRTKVK
jgi:glycosyltransferase involved in cell wall biosynthesis